MALNDFFRDRRGRLQVFDLPNVPILAWAGFGAASLMALTPRNRHLLGLLSKGSLLVWAGAEAWSGKSPFRRTMGAATLARQLTRQRAPSAAG